MSKVTISCDTKEKTLSVEVDGKGLENVVNAGIYKDGDMFGCEIAMVKRPESDGDMREITVLRASENGNLVEQGDLTKEIINMVFPDKE